MTTLPGPPVRAAAARFLSWSRLDPTAHSTFLAALAAEIGRAPDAPPPERVQATPLSFHPGTALVAVTYPASPFDVFAFLRSDEEQVPIILDGTNTPWFALGESGLFINSMTVGLYALCFFHFVHGKIGRFQLVGSAEDIPWLPDASEEQKAEIIDLLLPLTWLGRDTWGRYRLTGTVAFRNSLFRTGIAVVPTPLPTENPPSDAPGTIALLDEDLLRENLAIRVD